MTYEADELRLRIFQHEMDHLNGVLLIERLDEDTRKAALKTLRDLQIGGPKRSRPAAVSPCREHDPMSAAPPDAIRRIVYLGTPGLAVPPLRALVDAGYEVLLVVSRPTPAVAVVRNGCPRR